MRTTAFAVTLVTLISMAAPANADVGAKLELGAGIGANVLPTLAFGWSVRTQSRGAGAAEIVSGLGVGALNIYLASELYGIDDCAALCRIPGHLLVGVAVLDVLVAGHGMWTVMRDPPTASAGSARAVVSPTVLSDGHSYAAGLGVGGTF
jgi:hypothetical protein